jgi:Thiamine pyrophosphate enzyme, N-terminal TPP binding domain
MNGAQSLIRTLVGGGVDVCFANPGTSEMHFVASLDAVPEMRAVLALFEGVVTGVADGYGRMAERPAATLLHLGPGMANGLANLHNARRAHTPIVNVIGDHAMYHKGFGAAGVGHRISDRLAARLEPLIGRPNECGPGRCRGDRGGMHPAGSDCQPDRASGCVVGGRGRGGRPG